LFLYSIIVGSALFSSVESASSYGTLKAASVTTGICDPNVKQLSGYYSVSSSEDKNYFFWFFESRANPTTDPLIIWLTGGPGCSSQLALMTENGPCTPSPDGLDTVNNPYSWNSNANIMWIDQPAGVGYSYGSKTTNNESMVAEDMFNFLQAFFAENAQYQQNEFFVFGESYGGHYVPAVTSRIHKGNVNKEGLHINLQGLGVGNGLTDPVIQYQYYPQMAMNNSYGIKCVSEEKYAKMVDHVPSCIKLARACQANVELCDQADTYCNLEETTPYYKTGLNPYDIRRPCGDNSLCYDFSSTETFLNLPSTREALHVSAKAGPWTECNGAVNAVFVKDWMRNFQQNLIPMLEDGIRVLIYAGDVDFICNWMGNKAWTLNLTWSGKSAFNAAADQDWVFPSSQGSVKGGKVRSATAGKGKGSLTFLQVFEAGHMVPMDQPEAALAMLNAFLSNQAL